MTSLKKKIACVRIGDYWGHLDDSAKPDKQITVNQQGLWLAAAPVYLKATKE